MRNSLAAFVLMLNATCSGCYLYTATAEFQPDPVVAKNVSRQEALDTFRRYIERCTSGTGGEIEKDPRGMNDRRVDNFGFSYKYRFGALTRTHTWQYRQIEKAVIESFQSLGGRQFCVYLYDTTARRLDILYFGSDKEAAHMTAEALTTLAVQDRKGAQ